MTEHFVIVFDSTVRGGILTPVEAQVYHNLLSHQGINENAWPSHQTIANEIRTSTSSVKRAIQALVAYKLILVSHTYGPDGRQTSNRYAIVSTDGWSQGAGAQFRVNYKEYSSKENSNINRPSSKVYRSWGAISDTLPASQEQFDYLIALTQQNEDLTEAEARSFVQRMHIQSKKDAHDEIGSAFVEFKRQRFRET